MISMESFLLVLVISFSCSSGDLIESPEPNRNGYGLNILTSNRKWYLRAKTAEEREAWIEALKHSIEMP